MVLLVKTKNIDYFSATWLAALVLMALSLWIITRSNKAHFRGLAFESKFPSTTVLEEATSLDQKYDV